MKFQRHTKATAPHELREALEQIETKYGFMPNFYGVLAESPVALRAYVSVNEAFQHSVLTPIERQVVELTISVTTDCAYCVADHSILAHKVGIPEHDLVELRAQRPLPDRRLNSLRTLVLSIMYHRGWVPKEDLTQFAKAGYTQRHVLEIITLLALKTMSNYVNHVAKTPLDSQFASQVWSPNARTTS